MTGPVDPVRGAAAARPSRRGGSDRRRREAGEQRPDSSFPVPLAVEPHLEPEPAAASATAFDAQLLGQGGQKRGLKGGKEVLDQARGAYLGREYSGEADRRPRPGLVKKTEV